MLRAGMVFTLSVLHLFGAAAFADSAAELPRCEVIPLAGQQVSLRVDGAEQVRWHFGEAYERPFFFPFHGPGGSVLTRMGHPGAPNHDHHRSVWFAHQNVEGTDFWSNAGAGRIRQEQWYCYVDGKDEGVMAVRLGWDDGGNVRVMESDAVAALRPLDNGEHVLEIQLTCRAPEGRESVTLGKTNFGILAVRVAKTLSAHFGDGVITSSEGGIGEEQNFGQRARWMDYSGSVAVGLGSERGAETQGITYFDHPDNPGYPARWHVRADGWMCASLCMDEGLTIPADNPLILRYLLLAHGGGYDAARASGIAESFAASARFEISKSTAPNLQFEVVRFQTAK